MTTRILILLFIFTFVLLHPTVFGQASSSFELSQSGAVNSLWVDSASRLHVTVASDSAWYAIFLPNGTQLSSKTFSEVPVSSVDFAVGGSVALLVWRHVTQFFNSYVRAKVYSFDASSISNFTDINDSFADAQRHNPQAIALNDSTFFVVWSGDGPQTPSTSGIYAQVLSQGLDRIGANLFLSDDTISNRPNLTPEIAISKPTGTIAVCWLRGNGWGNSLVVRSFSLADVPLGPSRPVTSDTSRKYYWGHGVAALPGGGFLVTWSAAINDSICNIYARPFDANGIPSGPEVVVNATSASEFSEAEVSVDSSGHAIVVWESASSPVRIMAQRFGAFPSPSGGNFQLSHSSDTLNHFYPQVVVQRDTVYAVWNSQSGPRALVMPFNSVPVSVEERASDIPSTSELFVYPNPFNSSSTIRLHIVEDGWYILSVYDLLGRNVATLSDGILPAGVRSFVWDASGSASGMYLVRLYYSEKVLSTKLLLLK